MASPTATIAIVNEEATFIQLLRNLLEAEGYQSIAVPSSDMAYTTISTERPALVVLDVNPERPNTVWKLVELLLLDPETATIPLVLAAAPSEDLRARRERLEAQGCSVIEKPFHLDELLAVLRSRLAKTM
jgi:DNA-binding response OmpR family regulator